jgi:serine/threonine protein kinase
MRLVEGSDLRAVLRLKPSNVLIDAVGGREPCYLADFGITTKVREGDHADVSERLLGTLAYVAPEQIRGDHRQHGVGADAAERDRAIAVDDLERTQDPVVKHTRSRVRLPGQTADGPKVRAVRGWSV